MFITYWCTVLTLFQPKTSDDPSEGATENDTAGTVNKLRNLGAKRGTDLPLGRLGWSSTTVLLPYILRTFRRYPLLER